MSKTEEIITHLMIIHTWASYALERDDNFLNNTHMEDIIKWTEDAYTALQNQSNYEELAKKYKELAEWAEGHITFCKNCKHLEKDGIRKGVHYCIKTGLTVSDEWFCADGERK